MLIGLGAVHLVQMPVSKTVAVSSAMVRAFVRTSAPVCLCLGTSVEKWMAEHYPMVSAEQLEELCRRRIIYRRCTTLFCFKG